MNRTPIVLRLALLLVLSACDVQAAPQPRTPTTPAPVITETRQPPQTAPAPTPAGPAGLPEHRIGVRVVDGVGEFYDRVTGDKFIPRGNNYARLAPQKREDGSTQVYHSVFDPGQYDADEIGRQFSRMHREGYNVVRAFVSQNTIGTLADGLSQDYMRNVADFLRLAKENDLYVIFTQDWLPGGKYGALINQDCCDLFNFNNAQNLPPGAVSAYQAYYVDFIRALTQLGAPTDQIFSYELRNEFYYDTNYPPLSQASGQVTTANSQTYDMSSNADKQKMVEENLSYWIDSIRGTILQADPTALVSVGFFVPQGPNPARAGDARLVVSAPAIWNSEADFIDLHAYPGFELNLRQHVENFGVNDMQAKPIILGEFGANIHSFPSPDAAARALQDWQVESCQYGFDGWLLWTWDLSEQYEFYNALSGTGQIDSALSPTTRPDPCQPGPGGAGNPNLALGKSARASNFLADSPPSNAVDGSNGTLWNSGADPEQWIEIDLGGPSTIQTIRLTVSQYPAGATEHQVYVRGAGGGLRLVHKFSGQTADNDLLEFTPTSPIENIQVIRIVTVQSPSWVAWKEIEILVR